MKIFKFIFLLLIISSEARGETIFKDNFENPEKWLFITDQVMGGFSSGKVEFISINNNLHARMTGNVSTKNKGGFIQVRRKLEKLNLEGSKFIEIIAKGNNQNYFIHLRSSGTFLPWQYYQISFKVLNNFKKFNFTRRHTTHYLIRNKLPFFWIFKIVFKYRITYCFLG